jgi:two-component sensor histidine kinase
MPDHAHDPGGEAYPVFRRRALAVSIAGFWLFYVVINTVRHWAGAHEALQIPPLERRLVVSVVGMALSLVLYRALRPFDGSAMRVRLAVAFTTSVPVALAYAAFNYFAFNVYDPTPWPMPEPDPQAAMQATPLSTIIGGAADWYFFIVAWPVLYIALTNAERARLAERSAATYRAEAQAAQLRALRYQINPHFLFNTLNALSTIVMRGANAQAEQMIVSLASFLRMSLTTEPAEDVTLAEEVRLQLLYLDIERARFPDRLAIEVDVPEALQAALIPSLMLQPLIENAVRYGVSRTARRVTIRIRAAQAPGKLVLAVQDDGDGPPVPDAGHGVGLRNVRSRLAARFGAAATCDSGPCPAGGYKVSITMPLLLAGGEDRASDG